MPAAIQEDFLWGTLVGCAVGAAAALLLTPISGEQFRRKVQEELERLNVEPEIIKKRLQTAAHAFNIKRPNSSKKRSKSKAKTRKKANHGHKE